MDEPAYLVHLKKARDELAAILDLWRSMLRKSLPASTLSFLLCGPGLLVFDWWVYEGTTGDYIRLAIWAGTMVIWVNVIKSWTSNIKEYRQSRRLLAEWDKQIAEGEKE